MSDIRNVLIDNYMPYAKGTIVSRAIPAIDGLKPVNRRVLYTMYKMGLMKNRSKSSNIVGTTMKLHPHGDMAIYEALVRMTTGHEALNVPYVSSKGSFGKIYSKDTDFAAPRYTEAKLAEICEELFDSIDEDSVDFIGSYDNETTEPVLLPVKFPSILVNTSAGIAVGRSSDIPSFNLREVCAATVGIIDGTITNSEELVNVLGAPEFPTGGFIHLDLAEINKIVSTGAGSFNMSGAITLYQNKIVITQIPFRANVESIIDDIQENVKNGNIKEVADVRDETDLGGLRIAIELKRGMDPRKVLNKILVYTKVRMRMSFKTAVIINGRCEDLGLFELLNHWLAFRRSTIQRIYNFRHKKKSDQEYLLSAWEKIQVDVENIATLIASNTEEVVTQILKDKYGLEEKQIDYIMDMKVKEFTRNRLDKSLKTLQEVRDDIADIEIVLASDVEKDMIIRKELCDISDKYGRDRRTLLTEKIEHTDLKIDEKDEVENVDVLVMVTKRGYVKRFMNTRDYQKCVIPDGDEKLSLISCSNLDDLLIFTYGGHCYKIPVSEIEASRGSFKDYIHNLVEFFDNTEFIHIDSSRGYKGHFHVVYGNGRGKTVSLDKVAGNRKRYKNVFEGGEKGDIWLTLSDQFFLITEKRRAAFIDLEKYMVFNTRSTFKVARIQNDDKILGIQNITNVPDYQNLDTERYAKGYCVKITDTLW